MLKVKEMLKGNLGMVKEKFKRVKGGVNTTELLIIIAVVVLIIYPLFKTTMTSFGTTVQTWFSTVVGGIFS